MKIDGSLVTDSVLIVVVLSLFLERSLAFVFEHPLYVKTLGRKKGCKEIIALSSAFGICRIWGFDAYAMVFASEVTSYLGFILSAFLIAGGSKGSIKLFRDVLGIGKEATETKKYMKTATEYKK